jgi:signal transduction histidine kinase
MEKFKVLYIDDETNNLVGLKATFRMDYDILIAESAQAGEEILEQNPDIRIILCDQRMPGTTGIEFFEKISRIYSSPVRMLITGYTDIESVINAINRGHVFRYISKPWDANDVRFAIEEGNKYYITQTLLSLKNEQLQKAYEELDKFAYSVTHDMRGPIVSVLGAIELTKMAESLKEVHEIMEMMEQSVQRVEEFMRNMHYYYSLKRGELEIKEINIEELASELKDLFTPSANHANVQFDISLDKKEILRSDIVPLKIILTNLVSNAIKYQRIDNDAKFVQLEISITKGIATFIVADNGIGIEEVYLDDIFKMFFRATSENTGSGFGLYNVKDAIRKLNGDIQVKSKRGQGSEFIVTIPSK